MKTLYEKCLRAVEDGATLKVDFENRTAKLNGKRIIGPQTHATDMQPFDKQPLVDILGEIEDRYADYLHSIPSAADGDGRQANSYFKALPEKELHDDDMLYGMGRSIARARLELYVLLQVLSGNLRWDSKVMAGRWFWRSRFHPKLVILRKWIEPQPVPDNHGN